MTLQAHLPIKGRGTEQNPVNRFVPIHYGVEEALPDDERPSPKTRFFAEQARSILAKNDSPDLPFSWSLNPYRGCEHGCIYCYARPTHEYYGLSSGLDFETQIMVKKEAPELLRAQLMKKSWQPDVIMLCGNTDCYQPIERQLGITRRCLEVLAEFRHPVSIITKNRLVTRDIDLLQELALHQAVTVHLSITTLDDHLAGVMEPRATRPAGRLAAIRELSQAGIPVGVMTSPIIPGLNDHEMPELLSAAREAGATFANFVVLRLPYAIKELFANWLEQHFPASKDKVLNRVRDLRGGELYNADFATRMRGEGVWADLFQQQFRIHRKRLCYLPRMPAISTAAFRRPGLQQGMLFD